jgi:hypothetical protein
MIYPSWVYASNAVFSCGIFVIYPLTRRNYQRFVTENNLPYTNGRVAILSTTQLTHYELSNSHLNAIPITTMAIFTPKALHNLSFDEKYNA